MIVLLFAIIASGEAVECYTQDLCTGQTGEFSSGQECCLREGSSFTAGLPGPTGRVNCAPDTIIEDPLYTVPLKINHDDVQKINPQLAMEITTANPFSLCYEVQGNPDKYYNLVSSKCVTVNAHYSNAHDIDQIVIYGVSMVATRSSCQEIVVNDDCSYEPKIESPGIDIVTAKSRLSVTVSNCLDKELVIEIDCTTKPLRFQVTRGLDSKHENTHGLLGQFWNNPAKLFKFNGRANDDYDTSDLYTVEIANVGPKGSKSGQREITGHLKKIKWGKDPGYCLYVGNCNAGPMYGVRYPNDPVIEGKLSYYEVEKQINKATLAAYTFNQFDTGLC